MRGRVLPALLVVSVVVLLASCAAGPNDLVGTAATADGDPAGFWLGLWHGVIAPVTFLVSLFTETVGVYEVHNNGGWYDAGFLVGASLVLGGGAGSSSRAGRRRRA